MVHQNVDIYSLSTIQFNLLLTLYSCTSTENNYQTEKLYLNNISKISGIKKASLKNSLWRLKDKGFITHSRQKSGRGGWVIYQLPKEIYLDIKEYESKLNGSQNHTQMVHMKTYIIVVI